MSGTSPELVAMLLADARLPTGGHAQSGGLEPALRQGMSPSDIPVYCRARLASVVPVEAGVAVVARWRAVAGMPLVDVEREWEARTPSAVLRSASRAVGRGYRRLALRLWPEHPATLALHALRAPSRGSVLGVVAALTSLSPATLVRLVAYDDVQTVLTAALKLCPLDPLQTPQWVLELSGDIERLVPPLARLTEPADIPAQSAPQIEAWAQAHAAATRRLFSA